MAYFCQVSTDSVQLHIDGEIVAEKPLSSSFCKASMSNSRTKITLVGSNMQGYVHDAKILPLNLSIKDHYHKVLWFLELLCLLCQSRVFIFLFHKYTCFILGPTTSIVYWYFVCLWDWRRQWWCLEHCWWKG